MWGRARRFPNTEPSGSVFARLVPLLAGATAAAGGFVGLLMATAPADAVPLLSGQVKSGTLFVTGSLEGDVIVARLGANPNDLLIDFGGDGSAELSFDRSTFTAIDIDAKSGPDQVRIDETSGAFTNAESTTLRGGGGNDVLIGGSGAEVLDGGGGADVVDGNQNNDVALLGGGSDVHVWEPGDGSDVVEGSAGKDTLRFSGSNVAETIDVNPNGARVRVTRDVASVVMDLGAVENVELNTLGGADTVTVGNLSGTAARNVIVDLAASGGGGDAAADKVYVSGTFSADKLEILQAGGAASVKGLTATTSVKGGEVPSDELIVNSSDGDDSIEASPKVGALVRTVIDPGANNDTVFTDGTDGNNSFAVVANGVYTHVSDLTNGYDILGPDTLRVNGLGGADAISATGNLAALVPVLVFDGGSGNDTLLGSNGADLLLGGSGNDFVDGQQGTDTAFLGAGNDVFQWDPGDGSDTVEGQDGIDELRFNGSGAQELFDISANGTRARLTRNIATITMDLDGVETLNLKTFGSPDQVNVGDLAGTRVRDVVVDLAAVGGGGDAQLDQVFVNGTAGADAVEVRGAAPAGVVEGLAAETSVIGGEPGSDRLVVNTLGGDDSIEAVPSVAGFVGALVDGGPGNDTVFTDGTGGNDVFTTTANGTVARVDDLGAGGWFEVLAPETLQINGLGGADAMSATGNLAALVPLIVFDGGGGNDTLLGSNGGDLLLGGGGNDFVDGQQGNDLALLGTGNDVFQWDPGDGSDTVEGQSGTDELVFNGSSANEILNLSANGNRVRLTRNLANIVMDLNEIERHRINASGGSDVVTVGDLTGTNAVQVIVNLAALFGGGDAQPDGVIVTGTNGDDVIDVDGAGTSATVKGLAAMVQITGSEGANDSLDIATLAGVDSVDSTGLVPGTIQLKMDGLPV